MKRNDAREIVIQILFSKKFQNPDLEDFLSEDNRVSLREECELYENSMDSNSREYIETVLRNYEEHAEEIDELISTHAKGWNIGRISGTALAVLRCALTELLTCKDIPSAAAINSAVEISKHYDDEKTVSFINGVLGSALKAIRNADE